MYKLIIVDDEVEVREGIRYRTDWSDCGFELVGDYENGMDALEAVEAHQPDVVLTDINMPFMDGLELAERIAQRYRHIKVGMITGYEDFQYAKQAIKLKVNAYIMKPINAAQFTSYLRQLRKELDEEKAAREDLTRLRQQLHQSFPLLRERFLEQLATKRLSSEAIVRKLDYFGIRLCGPAYVALVCDLDQIGKHAGQRSEEDLELLRFGVFNIFQEIFEQESGDIVFRTRDDKIGVFISGQPADIALTSQTLAEHAAHNIGKYLSITVSIGIGRVCKDLQQLSISFREALSALDYRFLLGRNRIIVIDDVESASAMDSAWYEEWEKKLIFSLKMADEEEAMNTLKNWINELKGANSTLEAGYGTIYRLLAALMNLVAETGLEERALFPESPFTQVTGKKTLEDVGDWLETICKKILFALSDQRKKVAHAQITVAESYIKEHYADDQLSLNQVCGRLYISASYFSLLFKRHTGETFVEYLTRVRMEKARELLTLTRLKTCDIAYQVGFSDPQYFSVVFKRHTGMTPKQFRAARVGNPS